MCALVKLLFIYFLLEAVFCCVSHKLYLRIYAASIFCCYLPLLYLPPLSALTLSDVFPEACCLLPFLVYVFNCLGCFFTAVCWYIHAYWVPSGTSLALVSYTRPNADKRLRHHKIDIETDPSTMAPVTAFSFHDRCLALRRNQRIYCICTYIRKDSC